MIQTSISPTLDGLFQRILSRQPGALALLDPLNKQRITGQAPRRMTFAQADRAIPTGTFVTTSRTGRIGSVNAAIVPISSFSVVDREISGAGTCDGHGIKRARAD